MGMLTWCTSSSSYDATLHTHVQAFLSVPVHEQRRLRDWLLKRSSDAAKSSDELQASSSKGKQGDADAAAGEEDAFHSTKRMRTAYKCLLCKRTASYLCSYCCKGWYCSRDCQVEHWVEHRGQCMPEGESLDHEARSNRGSTMYQQIQTQQRMEAAGAGAGAAGGAGGARGPGGEAKNRQRPVLNASSEVYGGKALAGIPKAHHSTPFTRHQSARGRLGGRKGYPSQHAAAEVSTHLFSNKDGDVLFKHGST